MFEMTYDDGKKLTTVRITGDVDMYNVGALKEKLSEVKEGDVRLECGGMTYIDSTGIGVIASELSGAAKAGSSVTIAGLKPHIRKIFVLTSLDTIFDLEA